MRMKQGGTEEARSRRVMVVPVQARRRAAQEAQATNRQPLTPRGDGRVNPQGAILLTDARLPRKAPCGRIGVPVPETDTGGWGEKPKALERTLLKELCKLLP